MYKEGGSKMTEFWALRIGMDLERVETEVPVKLQDKVKAFIQEATQQE